MVRYTLIPQPRSRLTRYNLRGRPFDEHHTHTKPVVDLVGRRGRAAEGYGGGDGSTTDYGRRTDPVASRTDVAATASAAAVTDAADVVGLDRYRGNGRRRRRCR